MTEFGIQFGPKYKVLITANESVTLNGKELPVLFKEEIMPNITLMRHTK
jgi:hypothetical protein